VIQLVGRISGLLRPERPTAQDSEQPRNEASGTTYPAFFITVSTEDNRVGPGHARKLAARLEQVGAKAYYFEDSEGGHGVSDALQRPELMALRMTFLIDRLMN
jgi:prolyl oligopeptidase